MESFKPTLQGAKCVAMWGIGQAQGLKDLTSQISKNGFPKGSIIDSAHADRVLVPKGNNGIAAFQVGKNGTAKLKTTLNER